MRESTNCQTSYSSADQELPAVTDMLSLTGRKPMNTDGLYTAGTTPKGYRSYDADGIPSDAIKNTDTHIWIEDRYRPGKVYKHEHGRKSTYAVGCHCKRCSRARIQTDGARRIRMLEKGIDVADRVPSPVVAAHIEWLSEEKHIGKAALARMTGISCSTLRRTCASTKTMNGPEARLILAVTGDEEDGRGLRDYVPVDLTLKRLQSLMALGYTAECINVRMGNKASPTRGSGSGNTPNQILAGDRIRVSIDVAARIRQVYQEIGDTPATSVDIPRPASRTRALMRAARNGWPVPAMWDDPGGLGGEIEEPAPLESEIIDEVVIEKLMRREWPVPATRPEKLEVVRRILAQPGATRNDVVESLHISGETFYSYCQAAGVTPPTESASGLNGFTK